MSVRSLIVNIERYVLSKGDGTHSELHHGDPVKLELSDADVNEVVHQRRWFRFAQEEPATEGDEPKDTSDTTPTEVDKSGGETKLPPAPTT